jgi:hypothetical protein
MGPGGSDGALRLVVQVNTWAGAMLNRVSLQVIDTTLISHV